MFKENSHHHFATKAIHAGQEPDEVTGTIMVPIYTATSCEFDTESKIHPKNARYGRIGNPTRTPLEECVATLENAKYGLTFRSGLSAIQAVVNLCKTQDHILCSDDTDGGTRRMLEEVCRKLHDYDIQYMDMTSPAELEKQFKPTTKLVMVGSASDPNWKVYDFKALAEVTHRHGALLVVDNTVMTPYLCNPFDQGADIVIHSNAKYLSGHEHIIMGLVLTNNEELHPKLRLSQRMFGHIPSPLDCYLVMRGLKTLHVRMNQHLESARVITEWMENDSRIEKVIWPGLPSHPQHELAKSQFRGSGGSGMISFYLKEGLQDVGKFLENLKLISVAVSHGGVESVIDHPSTMTYSGVDEKVRTAVGITENLIKFSIGLEDPDDLIKDLDQSLNAAKILQNNSLPRVL